MLNLRKGFLKSMLIVLVLGASLIWLVNAVWTFIASSKDISPWNMLAIIVVAVVVLVVALLVLRSLKKPNPRRGSNSGAVPQPAGAAASTAPIPSPRKSDKERGVWSFLTTVVVLAAICFVIYLLSTCKSCSTSTCSPEASTQKMGRRPISINNTDWTLLPKAPSRKSRFQPELPSVRLRVKCANLLPNGTPDPASIKILDFSSEAGTSVVFPTCTECWLQAANTTEATVYWWEE